MANAKTIYAAYIALVLLLNMAIAATPLLASGKNPAAGTLYNNVFVYFCHQKVSRSLCLFEGNGNTFIADCLPQNGRYVPNDNRIVQVTQGLATGYKFPVCARDMAIYLGMLLAGVLYPLRYRLDRREFPDPLYLIAALLPMALDGGLQLVSDIGFSVPGIGFYESTNINRMVTGFIAGVVVPVYLLPILNQMFSKVKEVKVKE